MIVGIGSWRGTGATTTSLGLSAALAASGTSPWLVEADPAGGVLAARLADRGLRAGGLEHVAFPDTRDTPLVRLRAVASDLHGIRVVTAAGDPFRAWACHAPRVPWAPSLRDLDGPVVVDLGRLRGATPVRAVIDQCDAVLLVTSDDVIDLAASLQWLDAHGRAAPNDTPLVPGRTRVVIVDAAHSPTPVARADAEAELGELLAAHVPHDPHAVHALWRGATPGERRLRRSPFVHAMARLADDLLSAHGRRTAPAAPPVGAHATHSSPAPPFPAPSSPSSPSSSASPEAAA